MGGGGWGEPDRYPLTARGRHAFSVWYQDEYEYNILPLYSGTNFISNLEVVSGLNTLNLASFITYYNTSKNSIKYALKLYIGTPQTIGQEWNLDRQNGTFTDQKYPANQWPKNYQAGSQKGEANIMIFNCFMKKY